MIGWLSGPVALCCAVARYVLLSAERYWAAYKPSKYNPPSGSEGTCNWLDQHCGKSNVFKPPPGDFPLIGYNIAVPITF